MEWTLKQEKQPLLDRIEITFSAQGCEKTPSREEIREKLAAQLNVSEKLIVVKHIRQRFGSNEVSGFAHEYNHTISGWSARGSFDIIPQRLILDRIRIAIKEKGFEFSQFAKQRGISLRLLAQDRKKHGYLRETISFIGQELQDDALIAHATSDIYWDTIKSIEYAGIKKTYDLSIPDSHNFVANDIIVHNSHACGYALVSYQTAYLKANYPLEFMAALLNSRQADVDRIAFFVEEAKMMGINVLPPDINESLKNFTAIGENTIRFGLKAIKNVGEAVIETIIQERKTNGQFVDIIDVITRGNERTLNRKVLESFIKSGVFDSLGERNVFLTNVDSFLRVGQESRQEKTSLQGSLFGSARKPTPQLQTSEPASVQQKLLWERELLGLYVSGNPLEKHRELFEKKLLPINRIDDGLVNSTVYIGGTIEEIKRIITKKGDPMVFLRLKDFVDSLDVTIFPSVIENNGETWKEGNVAVIQGKVDKRNGALQVICERIKVLS